jgi:hypothetical protein
VKRGALRSSIVGGDGDQQIFRSVFCVLHENIEVAVLAKDSAVEQFVLKFVPAVPSVLTYKIVIRKCTLRILIQIFHVGVRGRVVEIEVVLLDVVSMVAFGVGQTKEPFFQDRIGAVPEGRREAQSLFVVGYSGDSVLSPAISSRPCLIMSEVEPGIAVDAVVLANGSPLALCQIGSPLPPWYGVPTSLHEALMLCA